MPSTLHALGFNLVRIGLPLCLAVGISGCGSGMTGSGSSPSPSPQPAPGPAPTTKAPIVGLVTMGSLGFTNAAGSLPDNAMEEIDAHPGIYSGAVINLLWSQLEPQQGVFDDSALTAALATIATYNAQYPATPVLAKLRINAGIGTPAWIFPLAGGPIAVTPPSGGTLQIGAFWTPAYRTAWQQLQAHLASEYDASPMIAEVAISSCSSLTDEPFITSLDAASLAAMRQYGYSDAADQACLTGAANDYASWTHTPLDFTFNSFRSSDACTGASNGSCLVEDPSFTYQVMNAFRAALGPGRSVVANHGLQSPLSASAQSFYGNFQTLYTQAQAESPPVTSPLEFQTFSPVVSWDATIQLGITYHPTEIEIWDTIAAGGHADLSTAQLQNYATELKAAQPQ